MKFKITNISKKKSVLVNANNVAHAMALARRQEKWRNYGADTDTYGYKNYHIELDVK